MILRQRIISNNNRDDNVSLADVTDDMSYVLVPVNLIKIKMSN